MATLKSIFRSYAVRIVLKVKNSMNKWHSLLYFMHTSLLFINDFGIYGDAIELLRLSHMEITCRIH